MAVKRKINPRHKPASMADVDKAYREGCILTMDLMMFTLLTDMEVSEEWMDKYHERYMAHLKAHKAGYLSQDDMRETTEKETGWRFELT